MEPLVTTAWLAEHLTDPDVRIVDATWFIPGEGKDAAALYDAAHLPGAVFMDLATLADPAQPGLNMLPPPALFAGRMSALGITDATRVILYDTSPYRTSARAWWMLRQYDKHAVAILDGGLAKWLAEGRPVERGPVTVRRTTYTAVPVAGGVRTLDQMRANIATRAEQVIDARGPSRFAGIEPEPRAGVAPGHIPGSRNLPYSELFHADGTWKTGHPLRAAFEDAGVELDRPLVTTCGSGVTASVVLFGAHLLGVHGALYDGSWSQWGADPAVPKATGAA